METTLSHSDGRTATGPALRAYTPHIGSRRGRPVVSTQAANATTITRSPAMTPSHPFLAALGPSSPTNPMPHDKDQRKTMSQGLGARPKSPLPALPAVKLTTIKRPPFMLGGAEAWTDNGHTCPVGHLPRVWAGLLLLLKEVIIIHQIPLLLCWQSSQPLWPTPRSPCLPRLVQLIRAA